MSNKAIQALQASKKALRKELLSVNKALKILREAEGVLGPQRTTYTKGLTGLIIKHLKGKWLTTREGVEILTKNNVKTNPANVSATLGQMTKKDMCERTKNKEGITAWYVKHA